MAQGTSLIPPNEQPPTVVQRTSPTPPNEEPPAAVQQNSTIPPDKQPPTVVQRISPVWPASPVPPSKQLPTRLQSATPVPVKSSYLEEIITNIKNKNSNDYLEKQFSQNLILKSKRGLKIKKTETVECIKDCFGEMLDNMDLVSWISNKLGYKPHHTKNLLEEKAYNKWRSLHPTTHQDIYKFGLSNSINSNKSRCSIVNISKWTFLQQCRFMIDENLTEKEVYLKSGTKKVFYNWRKIFSGSLRALHMKLNAMQTKNDSISAFYTYKAYYASKPTGKEKKSRMCINCLNPHHTSKVDQYITKVIEFAWIPVLNNLCQRAWSWW